MCATAHVLYDVDMSIQPDEVLMLNFLLEDKTPGALPAAQFLGRALRALRAHLQMDIAFISQFRDGKHVVSHADPSGPTRWCSRSAVQP